MPYAVASDDVKLYYEEAGEGTPILFIRVCRRFAHVGAPVQSFLTQLPLHCVQRSGVSAFGCTLDSYSQLRAAEDARDVLKHLGIEKAHIAGLSMAGSPRSILD